MSSLTLRGPYWVTVRQYRRTLWLAGAVVAASIVVIGGLAIWDAQVPNRYYEDGQQFPADDDRGYTLLRLALDYGGTWLLFLPLLVGAFVAGPLVAREFESGTYKLSLTQSAGPAAWLRAKLRTATVVALLTTLALIGVFRIGWSRIGDSWMYWADRGPYEATGIVLLAYALAAVAVGALLGLLIRRTLVAMAVTGLVMGVVLLALGVLRWSLLPVKTATGPVGPTLWAPDNPLIIESGLLTSSGARFDEHICAQEAADTPGAHTVEGLWGKVEAACQARHGVTAQYLDYHPESHFWPTQLIETGIVLALAGLALFAAFRVLRARHP
ncbi:ABC transporter permease [Streptomyces zaomyceticus]|uniref:ABC transporter permease n=1 Tax=Streptomyces zaomyceticus TaxID=68286 RepID=UPI0036BBEAB7